VARAAARAAAQAVARAVTVPRFVAAVAVVSALARAATGRAGCRAAGRVVMRGGDRATAGQGRVGRETYGRWAGRRWLERRWPKRRRLARRRLARRQLARRRLARRRLARRRLARRRLAWRHTSTAVRGAGHDSGGVAVATPWVMLCTVMLGAMPDEVWGVRGSSLESAQYAARDDVFDGAALSAQAPRICPYSASTNTRAQSGHVGGRGVGGGGRVGRRGRGQ
jgi:hypothetical protein